MGRLLCSIGICPWYLPAVFINNGVATAYCICSSSPSIFSLALLLSTTGSFASLVISLFVNWPRGFPRLSEHSRFSRGRGGADPTLWGYRASAQRLRIEPSQTLSGHPTGLITELSSVGARWNQMMIETCLRDGLAASSFFGYFCIQSH